MPLTKGLIFYTITSCARPVTVTPRAVPVLQKYHNSTFTDQIFMKTMKFNQLFCTLLYSILLDSTLLFSTDNFKMA